MCSNNIQLRVSKVQVEGERKYSLGESETFDSIFPKLFSKKAMLKELMREYGHCIGKMFVGEPPSQKHIGYVFQKRLAFEDSPKDTYLCETWVEVLQ